MILNMIIPALIIFYFFFSISLTSSLIEISGQPIKWIPVSTQGAGSSSTRSRGGAGGSDGGLGKATSGSAATRGSRKRPAAATTTAAEEPINDAEEAPTPSKPEGPFAT